MKVTSFNSIAQLVKQSRIKKGWSQNDLAHLVGFNRGGSQHISNIERGLCNLPPKHAPAICKVLDISKDELIEAMAKDFKRSIEIIFIEENKVVT